MEKKTPSLWLLLLQVSQPLILLMVIFTYALGLGIVHYLGSTVEWANALLGLILVVAVILEKFFLEAYFDFPEPLHSPRVNRMNTEGQLEFIETRNIPRNCLLQVSFVCLTLVAVVSVFLAFRHAISLSAFLVLVIALVLTIFDAVPPIRLKKRGYSELIEAVIVANMSPALAFLLQKAEMHILVIMFTLPLTFLYISLEIASSLQYYSYDAEHKSGSILTFIGWQRGMTIHNLSILSAFLLIAAFMVMGLSWNLTWPIFLALPLGALQIFQMVKINDGAKPNWSLLSLNSLGTFLIVVYLIAYTLWIH